MCAAMETAVELDYSAVLPDVNPVQAHQQKPYRVAVELSVC